MIVNKIADGTVVGYDVKDRTITFSSGKNTLSVEIPSTNSGPEQVIDVYRSADGKLSLNRDSLHAVTLKIPPSRTTSVNSGKKDTEGHIIIETAVAEVSMDQIVVDLWPFDI